MRQEFFISNSKGFSLIELMVAVGVIATLAAVAVPVYSSFTYKSREVEAKASLSTLYTAQKTFFMQYEAYHSSFQAIGFAPEGFVHFNVGFGSVGTVAGPAHGFSPVVDTNRINSTSYCGGAGGANIPGNNCTLANLTPTLSPLLTVTPTFFSAGAIINRLLYANSDPKSLPDQLLTSSPIVQLAMGALFSPVHAVPPSINTYSLQSGEEMFYMDANKIIRKYTSSEASVSSH